MLSIVLGAIGQVIIKIGANKLGSLSLTTGSFAFDLLRIARTPEIIGGMVFFGTSSILWIKVLTGAELSQAYPLVSLSYLIVTVLSCLLFREQFTVQKVIGIVVIMSGVIMLNK